CVSSANHFHPKCTAHIQKCTQIARNVLVKCQKKVPYCSVTGIQYNPFCKTVQKLCAETRLSLKRICLKKGPKGCAVYDIKRTRYCAKKQKSCAAYKHQQLKKCVKTKTICAKKEVKF